MAAVDLFRGFSVVIDDQVGVADANVQGILDQIRGESIPLTVYQELPNENDVVHFRGVSFIFLDWNLTGSEISAAEKEKGVMLPDNLLEDNATQNIDFIKSIREVCFCPIFIFTNEDREEIELRLIDAGLFVKDKPNHLFIKSKNEVNKDGKLFEVIEEWMKKNPSVYVLKEWEKEYNVAKNRLFNDFHSLSPLWAKIVWSTVEEDGGNHSLELGELLMRNLQTRMVPFEFDAEILNQDVGEFDRDELRRVLEGEKFLTKLHDGPMTGDIYSKDVEQGESTERKYWLNIRGQCDLMRGDDPCLYCIVGTEAIQNDSGNITAASFSQGEYLEKGNHAIVPFIDGGKIVEFKFGQLEQITVSQMKDQGAERLGCLLPPYITKIQQRFALYMQRQALPRIPKRAIKPVKGNS